MKINLAAEKALTPAMVREILRYDPLTGVFNWKVDRGTKVKAGDVAGHIVADSGYVRIRTGGHGYWAHRLAWAYMLGRWPDDLVDHRDGCASNNKWINLRPATYSQNNRNRKVPAGASGVKGVFFDNNLTSKAKRWRVVIRVDGKRMNVGSFHTAHEAEKAHAEASKKHQGEFNMLERA